LAWVWKGVTNEQQLNALERSAAQHEKQIQAIRALMHEGMRLMVETRKDIPETRKDLRALAANVRDLTNGLRGGPNGHAKRKVDLQ
jgi:predicted  nucleic acid-binding Zn-ribbon protein